MQDGPDREGRPSEEESSSAAATVTVGVADDETPGTDVEVVPICVPLPTSDVALLAGEVSPSSASAPASASAAAAAGAPCVVGTVTILKRSSAIVWIGWGMAAADGDDAVARSSLPPMGPLVVSMPRTRYAGMSPGSGGGGGPGVGEAACSQLIGGESDEDQMTSWQMASRLSRKVGWPVFVSSSLAVGGGGIVPPSATTSSSAAGGGGGGEVMSGVGEALGGLGLGGTDVASPQRAAALAEREVGRILLQRKQAGMVEVVADE